MTTPLRIVRVMAYATPFEQCSHDEHRGYGTMRKRYKDKKCCCKMCKDYKRGWTKRWKARELAKLKRFEKSVKTGQYDNV